MKKEKKRSISLDIREEVKPDNKSKVRIRAKDALIKMSSAAISVTDYDSFFSFALEELGILTGSNRVYLLEFNENNMAEIINSHEWTAEGIDSQISFINDFYTKHATHLTRKLNQSKLVNYDDLARIMRDKIKLAGDKQIKSLLIVPIYLKNRLHGLLWFNGCRNEKDWSGDNINLLETAAHIISQVIERRYQLNALTESEKKYRDLVENSDYGIFIIQDNTIKYANNKMLQILGLENKEIIGKNFLKFIHEENKVFLAEQTAKWQSGDKLFQGYESKVLRKDGSIRSVEISSNFIIYKGRKAIQGNVVDLTENKEKRMKKLKQRIRKVDKNIIPLTKKEKLVFYSITKYPLWNDRQILEKTDVPISTISSIRKRLKREGYYKEIIIPNFSSLGFSSLSFSFGKIRHHKNNTKMDKDPYTYYELESSNRIIRFLINPEELGALSDSTVNTAVSDDEDSCDIVHLPFDVSTFPDFFDFSDILKNRFYLDIDTEKNREYLKFTNNKKRFTKREKIVLYALCKYPYMNDTQLSQKIDIPRSTISVIRKRFIKENVIIKSNIPIFKKIGCELMTIVIFRLIKPIDQSKFALMQSPFSFFIGNNNQEIICQSLYQNYSVFKSTIQDMVNFLYNNRNINSEPEIMIIPLNSIKNFKMDLASLVKDIFKLDVNF